MVLIVAIKNQQLDVLLSHFLRALYSHTKKALSELSRSRWRVTRKEVRIISGTWFASSANDIIDSSTVFWDDVFGYILGGTNVLEVPDTLYPPITSSSSSLFVPLALFPFPLLDDFQPRKRHLFAL